MFFRLLARLLAHRIDGTEPRLVDLDQPMHLIGLSVDTTEKRIYRDVPRLGQVYQKRKSEIPNKRHPWVFAAVSQGYDPVTGSLTYTMGDVVTSLESIPAGLIGFDIPAGKYAVFPVRPRNRLGWPFAIGDAKRYIYTVWLPQSGYEPAGTIDDFEYHDARSTDKRHPEIDLYVAIKPRG